MPLAGQSYLTSLDLQVSHAPEPVIINGQPTVYYELHVTNFASIPLDLKKLEVVNTVNTARLLVSSEADLQKRCEPVGALSPGGTTTLVSGGRCIIYLEYALTGNPPWQISHRIDFEIPQSSAGRLHSVQGANLHLIQAKSIVLGAPLREGSWAAVYYPDWKRGHRRVVYTVDGKARIPGRFAIDFIRLDRNGKYASEDENLIKNWYGYGNDVLAVADGVIVAVKNEFAESATIAAHPRHPPEQATGNFLALQIGDKRFVFYEHLKPDSIRVKIGQKVKRGDILAAVGFTGQTTGPHLHLHVADGNSPLGAEGLPFVFELFTVLGEYADFADFGKKLWESAKEASPSAKRRERPAPNAIITFEER